MPYETGIEGHLGSPILASIIILGILGLSQDAWAPTKIVPTLAEPVHPFTLIDTPEGRLMDGTVAVFTFNGASTEVSLETHKSDKTA